jgi:hypothetical protein
MGRCVGGGGVSGLGVAEEINRIYERKKGRVGYLFFCRGNVALQVIPHNALLFALPF